MKMWGMQETQRRLMKAYLAGQGKESYNARREAIILLKRLRAFKKKKED